MLHLTIEITIVLALIGLNGLLAMAELAVVSSRKIRLQQAAEKGDRGAIAALSLASEPTRFLSTVQIGITLIGILAGVFGGARIAGRVANQLENLGVSSSLSDTLSYPLVVLSITYLSLIFGELVPKRIALHRPEGIAALIARPMQLLSLAASPFVLILTSSVSVVLHVIGLRGRDDSAISEEEIRIMIGMSAQSGSVAEEEAELLDRVFHFGDRRVHEVMVPRTEVIWLAKGATVRDFYKVYAEHPHSRFPVYDDSPDRVLGVVGIKDVLRAVAQGKMGEDSPVEAVTRPAYFVPETKLVGELFRELQASHNQMAVAVDEHGGTAGIVTLEQLLEEMVGSVGDELHPAEEEIKEIDPETLHVDGSLSVEEAREELGIDIPEGDYDTIAGFVLSQLGHIPEQGESVPVDGHRITVIEMAGQKIEVLQVTKT